MKAKCSYLVSSSLLTHCMALLLIFFSFSANTVFAAASPWSKKIQLQSNFVNYSSSEIRDKAYIFGSYLNLDYLDRGGLVVGTYFSHTNGLNSNPLNIDQIEEQVIYLSAKYDLFSDRLSGKLGFRLDGYSAESETTTSVVSVVAPGQGNRSKYVRVTAIQEDAVAVMNPILSFTNYSKTRYMELSYAISDYEYEQASFVDFKVQQISPAIGFSWNQKYDWLQVRGYFITPDENLPTQSKQNTQAIELKWTHWFAPNTLLNLHGLGVNVLLGERIFALDSDAREVYSFADLQTGGFSMTARWKPQEQMLLMFQLGLHKYENMLMSNEYRSASLYLNISHKW